MPIACPLPFPFATTNVDPSLCFLCVFLYNKIICIILEKHVCRLFQINNCFYNNNTIYKRITTEQLYSVIFKHHQRLVRIKPNQPYNNNTMAFVAKVFTSFSLIPLNILSNASLLYTQTTLPLFQPQIISLIVGKVRTHNIVNVQMNTPSWFTFYDTQTGSKKFISLLDTR